MARGKCTFRQQDVTRALKATIAAGLEVQRIEINKDGNISVVTTGPEGNTDESDSGPNEWDKVLHDKTS